MEVVDKDGNVLYKLSEKVEENNGGEYTRIDAEPICADVPGSQPSHNSPAAQASDDFPQQSSSSGAWPTAQSDPWWPSDAGSGGEGSLAHLGDSDW